MISVASGEHLKRVEYNNPGLVVDLGVGLWPVPVPIDYDEDGDNDLVIAVTQDVPDGYVYFFENPDGNVKMPVFKPGIRIGKKHTRIWPSYVNGKLRLMVPAAELIDFKESKFQKTVKIYPTENIHHAKGRVRGNQWGYYDFDGDGDQDLIVGIGDWTDYGWDDAFSSDGRWLRGPLHGYVYLIANNGSDKKPIYAKPVKILADGRPVDVYGFPSPNFADFDGDGDLDLLCGEFVDTMTYFENVGTRCQPRYAAGRMLTYQGKEIFMDECMITPIAFDWDKDQDMDLIVGQVDGRIAFIENTGTIANGMPQFLPPRFFQQRADHVMFGALNTPCSFDWDGDGDEDLICGNSSGYIGFFENLDGGNPPKWAKVTYLEAEGEVIRIQAGYNGSIQGPCERKWGYTVLSVADWDHDGLPDIAANSIWGKVVWYRNVGTREKPKLSSARPIEVDWSNKPPKPPWNWWKPEGKELVTQWRTSPVVIDVNKDGLNDLVMLDHEGFLAFFQRRKVDGELKLLPGRRIFYGDSNSCIFDHINNVVFLDANEDGVNDLTRREQDGSSLYYYQVPGSKEKNLRSAKKIYTNKKEADTFISTGQDATLLRLNAGWAGRSGRRKFTLVDWDRDGKLDLLVNSTNIDLLHNIGTEGSYVFRNKGPIVADKLAGHTTCPTFVDWDKDGVHDLLIGAEDGFLYYYPRKSSQELLGGK